MNQFSVVGLLSIALMPAAPMMANPIIPPTTEITPPAIAANPNQEETSNRSIQSLSEMKVPPRTLSESGISKDPIVPLLSGEIIIPSTITITPESPETRQVVRPINPQIGGRFTSQGGGTDSAIGIEGFVPLAQTVGQSLTYLEGRLQLATEAGRLGGNLLVGHRFLSHSKRQILGGYLAYDHRHTGETGFNQLGVGLEMLSEGLDVRANAYFPLGKSSRSTGDQGIGDLAFQGNNLRVDRVQAVQEALTGFDLELGTQLFKLGKHPVRGYLGGYYYDSDRGEFVGVRSRLVARPTDFLTAGLTLQTDSRFDTRLMVNVGVQFPASRTPRSPKNRNITINPTDLKPIDLSQRSDILIDPNQDGNIPITPSQSSDIIIHTSHIPINPGLLTLSQNSAREIPVPRQTLLNRLSESPDRQTSIVVDQYVLRESELAINPATGEPWEFQFVNLGIGTGNGTFEAPTGTIEQVAVRPGNIVYVNAGRNPGIPGFRIPDSIRVISDAVITTIPTQFGTVPLPNGGTGNFPLITSTVTMGNDTQLTGFAIANSPENGVQGLDIRDFRISDNQISNAGGGGIILNNVGGRIEIDNNQVSNTPGNGIFVQVSSAEATALIRNNRVDRPGIDGIFGLSDGNGKLTAEIRNNQVTGDASSQRAGIATGSRNNGIINAIIEENTVSGFTNPGTGGIRVFAEDTSQTTATLIRNTARNNRRGIAVNAETNARVQTTLVDNTVTENLEEGIFVVSGINGNELGTGASRAAAILDNNRVSNNQTAGTGYGDVAGVSFSPEAQVCLRLSNNQIGTLTFADTPQPNFTFTPQIAGRVSVELPVTRTNPGSNRITTVSPITQNWSGTAIPSDSCRLP